MTLVLKYFFKFTNINITTATYALQENESDVRQLSAQPITAIHEKKLLSIAQGNHILMLQSENYMEEMECRINFLKTPCPMYYM